MSRDREKEHRCHWCDDLIQKAEGYHIIETHEPSRTLAIEIGSLNLFSDTVRTHACWHCGVREIEERIKW